MTVTIGGIAQEELVLFGRVPLLLSMDNEQYNQLVDEDPTVIKYLEYNRGSWRNGPYWRAKPYYRNRPTPGQARHRIAFIESAMSAYGKKGLAEVDGVLMPQASKGVQLGLRGKKFAEITTKQRRFQCTRNRVTAYHKMQFKVTMARLREALMGVARVVEKR